METIIIKIKDKKNVTLFLEMINKFNFITDIKLGKKVHSTKDLNDAPIDWAKTKPLISDFSGIWMGRNITLDELRIKAWKRN